MDYIYSDDRFELGRHSAVTLGKFDGVHMGHQKLISIVKEKAKEKGLLSVVFTFDRIPLSICPQKNQHFITTNAERRKIFESFGIDVEIEYPFTNEFMRMEPEDFVKEIKKNLKKKEKKYQLMLMQISILLQNKILSSILKKVQKISEPFLFLAHIKNIRRRTDIFIQYS